jgi:hypothetical protein
MIGMQSGRDTLAFLAGWLTGAADRRFGTGTAWTMMLWSDMENGKLTIDYLYSLERSIARRWPKDETPPSVREVLQRANAGPSQAVEDAEGSAKT